MSMMCHPDNLLERAFSKELLFYDTPPFKQYIQYNIVNNIYDRVYNKIHSLLNCMYKIGTNYRIFADT
jgi:hypothetical protein